MITVPIKVLDHGYVRYIDHMGSDESFIEAARMSTDGEFRSWLIDEKLLKFLFDNHHDTPFEFGELVVEVQAPILVFREWHRHRTQSYNEASARYIKLPDINYLPSLDRLTGIDLATSNKQAQGNGKVITKTKAKLIQALWRASYWLSGFVYDAALKLGAPKELARIVMPVGHYSKMRAKANVRNWLAFLRLREADNAQYEIRQYANTVADILEEAFPRAVALYRDLPMSYLQVCIEGKWFFVDKTSTSGNLGITHSAADAMQTVHGKHVIESYRRAYTFRAVLPSDIR